MKKPEHVEVMPADQVAELARLEARAAEADVSAQAGSEPAMAAQAPAPAVSPEESLSGVLCIASMLADRFGYKRAAAIWSNEVCREFAARAIPVLQKYPWGNKIVTMLQSGAGVEEIALVIYAAPIIVSTIAAVRIDADAAIVDTKEGASESDTGQGPA